MCKYVSYFRVSTQKQGISGLGIEAQQAAVHTYLAGRDHSIIGEFIEIESGRNADRPKLAEAIALARRNKATLIIARLDRLARSVAFISQLMESSVQFIACDLPDANRLTLHILAAVAEAEARAISERTKAAMAAAKARGVILGNTTNLAEVQVMARRALVQQAERRSIDLLPTIHQIVLSGVRSVHRVADELNRRNVKTAQGKQWHGATVANIIKRRGYATLGALANSGAPTSPCHKAS